MLAGKVCLKPSNPLQASCIYLRQAKFWHLQISLRSFKGSSYYPLPHHFSYLSTATAKSKRMALAATAAITGKGLFKRVFMSGRASRLVWLLPSMIWSDNPCLLPEASGLCSGVQCFLLSNYLCYLTILSTKTSKIISVGKRKCMDSCARLGRPVDWMNCTKACLQRGKNRMWVHSLYQWPEPKTFEPLEKSLCTAETLEFFVQEFAGAVSIRVTLACGVLRVSN